MYRLRWTRLVVQPIGSTSLAAQRCAEPPAFSRLVLVFCQSPIPGHRLSLSPFSLSPCLSQSGQKLLLNTRPLFAKVTPEMTVRARLHVSAHRYTDCSHACIGHLSFLLTWESRDHRPIGGRLLVGRVGYDRPSSKDLAPEAPIPRDLRSPPQWAHYFFFCLLFVPKSAIRNLAIPNLSHAPSRSSPRPR